MHGQFAASRRTAPPATLLVSHPIWTEEHTVPFNLMTELILLRHAELLREAESRRQAAVVRRSCAAARAARRAARRRAGPDPF